MDYLCGSHTKFKTEYHFVWVTKGASIVSILQAFFQEKIIFIIGLLLVSSISIASNLNVSNANVMKVQVYETTDNSTNVWIHLNGSGRVGPNPVNTSSTCELWTKDSGVH